MIIKINIFPFLKVFCIMFNNKCAGSFLKVFNLDDVLKIHLICSLDSVYVVIIKFIN